MSHCAQPFHASSAVGLNTTLNEGVWVETWVGCVRHPTRWAAHNLLWVVKVLDKVLISVPYETNVLIWLRRTIIFRCGFFPPQLPRHSFFQSLTLLKSGWSTCQTLTCPHFNLSKKSWNIKTKWKTIRSHLLLLLYEWFATERCSGCKVLLELGLRLLSAAVAAAGRAAPRPLEGRSLGGAARRAFHTELWHLYVWARYY